MTELQIYTLLGLFCYFVLLIILGYLDSRKQNHEGFVIGNRSVGLLPTISSVTSSYRDGSGVVFFVGASLTIGYAGFWYFLVATISLFCFGLFASKMRNVAAENNYITIGELLRGQLGPVTEKTASVLVLLFSLLYIMIQLYVSGNILSRLIGLPELVAVVSIGSVVALYLFFGGYGTVIRTDLLQFFVILSMAIIPFFIKPDLAEVLDFSSFLAADPKIIIGLCIMGLFGPIANADMWQRVFSAKDEKTIKVAFPLSGLFLAIMTMTLITIGMGIKKIFPDAEPGDLVFVLYQGGAATEHIPTVILAFFAIGVMSITMSTLDTMCYLFASTLSKNFLPEKLHNTRERYMKFSRIVFVCIIALMCFLSMLVDDIIGTIISVITMVTILAPVYMSCALGVLKRSVRLDYMMSGTIIISLGVYIVLFTMGIMGDLLLSNIPSLVSAALCVVCLVMDRYLLRKTV